MHQILNHTSMISLIISHKQIVTIVFLAFSGLSIISCKEAVKEHTNNEQMVPAEAKARLTAIYKKGEFRVKSFWGKWSPYGSVYFILETKSGSEAQQLVSYDVSNGERMVASELIPAGKSEPLNIQNFSFSPDGDRIILNTDNLDSGYWLLDLNTGQLKELQTNHYPNFSPDGKHIAFSDQGNLHVYDLQTNQTISLTKNGNDAISIGKIIWSPDGKKIAYVQSDQSEVRLRSMLMPGDPSYPVVREMRFARVGGTIASLHVGVINVEGGNTQWLSIEAPAEGYYLGQISWTGNSDELLVEKLSRFRDQRDFLMANINTGEINNIYKESDPAWVISSRYTNSGVNWITGHRAFILINEKDGWRHAYVYSREGKEQTLLTPGQFDIIDRVKVDEQGGWFYFYASPDNATQKYLYRVPLDGSAEPERITPMGQPGTHDYEFSADANWAFHTYTSFDLPPVTELVEFPEHRVERTLEDNDELLKKTRPLITEPTEFFQLDIGDDVVMDALMIKPRDFDPSKKYPVFIYVYSEPHAQTVLDAWGRASADYHRVIADLGYLVVTMDSRGTPAPKGAAWRRSIFPSLGPLSTEEQAAGLQELGRTRPYVDLTRVGIWGWSGGGSNTLNAMFRKPDMYHVGIAVAPKPQPHLYNAWFQEIYMNTPEVNSEGYQKSAPINNAEGLEGDLLIIHGSGETNTHIQITEGLVDRLIELGKPFDYMVYPDRNHGIRKGEGTSLHLRMLMTRYLLAHLPPGPQ